MEKNNFEGDKTHILADNYIKKSKRNLKFKSHNPNRNKKRKKHKFMGQIWIIMSYLVASL